MASYMCKMENVAGLTEALNNATYNGPQIRYTFVSKNTGTVNDVNLDIPSTRYQVISVSDLTYKYLIFPAYSNVTNRWWVRVFDGNLNPVYNTDVVLLVIYLDFGQEFTPPTTE